MKNHKGSFKEQWKHPELFSLPGGVVEIYDITPRKQKTKVPVVFIPGWGGTPEMYKKNIRVLVALERRIVLVHAPHGAEYKINNENARGIPNAELREIAALMGSLDKKRIKKVDAIGHSEGGIHIALAAKLHPKRFRNIILVDPGGMIGKDNSWNLVMRSSLDAMESYIDAIRNKELRGPLFRVSYEVVKSALKNPAHAFQGARSIARVRIWRALRELKQKGIGISVTHGVDDQVFPMERMQNITKKDMVDGFYSVKGRHSQFIVDADRYTKLVESALTALEKKVAKTHEK